MNLWERRAHLGVRRFIYAMFAAVCLLLIPLQFIQGQPIVGVVILGVLAALLVGHSTADTEHRNAIAAGVLLFMNAALIPAGASFQLPMGIHHVATICLAFVLIERHRVVLQRVLNRWTGVGSDGPDAEATSAGKPAPTSAGKPAPSPVSADVLGELDALVLDRAQLEEASSHDLEDQRELEGVRAELATLREAVRAVFSR